MTEYQLILLLTNAQEYIRTADRIEPVENGPIGPIGKSIGVIGDCRPDTTDEVGTKFGNQEPGRIGAGRCHYDVRANLNGKDLVGIWHRPDKAG